MKVWVETGERRFLIEDLGELMNSQFLRLYDSRFSGRDFDLAGFTSAAVGFFDQNDSNQDAHDGFFNNFTVIWTAFLKQGRFKDAKNLWGLALNIAHEWEDQNQGKRIHKGTPYYFWGVTCILQGDLERGFLLMHQALEEDKTTHQTSTPETPAYWFVTLDYEKQDQFFRPKVKEIAEFVGQRVVAYRTSRGRTLALADFKSCFLEEPNLQEVVFYFVLESFRLRKLLVEIDQRLTQNVFGALLQTNIIFDFCLIVENTLREQKKHKNVDLSQQTMNPLLTFLSKRCSLNLHRDSNLRNLNGDFKNNFSVTVQELLTSQYHFRDGTPPQPIEEDLAITYGFRNRWAHRIEDQPVVLSNFAEISQRILNALFFTVETLYT